MQYILKVFFSDGKDLVIILKKEEKDLFLECMQGNKIFWAKDANSGIGISIYSVKYYQCFEYTEEMKKADEERAKKQEELKKAKETTEESK